MSAVPPPRVLPFGVASGRPTAVRHVSGLAYDPGGGRWILVDCGEGTQQQIMRSPLKISRIDAICITHLHGDHVLGLPGLLGTMGIEGRTAPLTLVGPVGLRRWLDVMLDLPILGLAFDLQLIELDGPTELPPMAGQTVRTEPLVHRVPSFGFRFEGPARRGRIDPAAAAALGITAGPDLGRLQRGETVRGVRAEQVCGPDRPGTVVTILGDTMWAPGSVSLARDADLLVHECTYGVGEHHRCEQWMHACSEDVAAVASAAGVRHVVINHYSTRYEDPERLRAEVAARVPDGVAVTAAVEGEAVPVAAGSPRSAGPIPGN